MASEIRVNKIENRSGLGTVTFADTGVDLAGIVTATTFSGSGASLTALPAAQLSGALPAISAANLTNVPAANVVGVHTSLTVTNATTTGTAVVGGGVTISESGIEASGIGITCANINGTQIGGRRNLIINGAMQVAQRDTSFTDPTGVAYTLDRFAMQNNSGTPAFNVTQDSDAPHGFNKSLKVACTTADASPASGSISRVYQYIEAQNMQGLAKGTSSAKACTLSFYVKTNKTGLYTVFVYDADNTRLMSGGYTVSNTDWNRYTILIPADTTGVLDNGNGQGFGIFWGLSLGSDRTSGSLQSSFGSYAVSKEHAGNVNFADNTSNVWYLTGAQLEVGPQATPFEHRSFGEELALCQRYYQFIDYYSNTGSASHAYKYAENISYYTEMRATPTFSSSARGSNSGTASPSAWSASGYLSQYHCSINVGSQTHAFTGRAKLDAEL